MKRLTTAALLLLSSLPSASDIYKTTDQHGNVIYTDNPHSSKSAEKVDLPPVTRIPAPDNVQPSRYQSASTATQKQPQRILEIIEPANDATIRNNGNFTVRVSVSPRLSSSERLQLTVNGVVKGKPQRSPIFALENVDRGVQKLGVAIISNKGKVIKSTSSTVHVQRPVIRPSGG